jgi:hypothetical protein
MQPDNRICTGKWVILAILASTSLAMLGCDDHHGNPKVEFLEPADGATLTGPNILVRIRLTDFTLGTAGPLAKVAGADGSGHVHLFLDIPPGQRFDAAAIAKPASDTVTITVPPGAHYLIAQGADDAHVPIPGMIDSVAFTVQ